VGDRVERGLAGLDEAARLAHGEKSAYLYTALPACLAGPREQAKKYMALYEGNATSPLEICISEVSHLKIQAFSLFALLA